MMYRRRWALMAALVGLLIGCSPYAFADDVAAAEAQGGDLYYPCSGCHGADGAGNEALRAPALAGLSAQYIARQLVHFRNGIRGAHPQDHAGQEMSLLAKTLRGPGEIASVSAYAAGLPIAGAPGARGTAAKADARYATCAVCHGERAEGNASLGAPALFQQGGWYLEAQLRAFRRGWRGVHADDAEGRQMRAALAATPDGRGDAALARHISELRLAVARPQR